MQINIIAVGRLKDSPEKELCERYLTRMQPNPVIKEVEERRNLEDEVLIKREGELIMASCSPNSKIIAMDETGIHWNSQELASKILNAQQNTKTIDFLIGGHNGLSKNILDKADTILALGRFTWPHMMARVMILEQLYRAQKIIAGHPYHRK